MLAITETTIGTLCKLLVGAVAVAIILMMLAVTLDVTAKYLFGYPIYGTSEIVGNYFMVAIVFLSIPIVELSNKAIYVDLFYNLMARSGRIVCLVIVYLSQIAFFGVLGYQSWFDSIESFAKREVVAGVIDIIIWPSRFMLLIGFALAFAISVLRLVQLAIMDPAIERLLSPTEPHISEEEI